jgi:HD domain-containing protein
VNRSDFNRLREWFDAYCRKFLTDDEEANRNILLKEEHTRRVCVFMGRIAENLGLAEDDRLLAEAIALCHDVGRFEQYRRYRTFKDSESVNHAALGASVLRGCGILDALPDSERRTLCQTVSLHNVFRIPDGLGGSLARFVRMIRDADKLDIWRVFIEYYALPDEDRASAVGLGFPDHPRCSSAVVAEVRRGQMVDLGRVVTLNDFKLLQISWVYDLNFAISFRIAREAGYFDALAATLPASDEVKGILTAVKDFMGHRL